MKAQQADHSQLTMNQWRQLEAMQNTEREMRQRQAALDEMTNTVKDLQAKLQRENESWQQLAADEVSLRQLPEGKIIHTQQGKSNNQFDITPPATSAHTPNERARKRTLSEKFYYRAMPKPQAQIGAQTGTKNILLDYSR